MTAFSETFQSEIYSIIKQIFLLNAQFTIVCFDQENMRGQRGTLRALAVICHSH